MTRAEGLVEAFARGLAQGLVADSAAVVVSSAQSGRAKARRRRPGSDRPPSRPSSSVVPREVVPRPGFDPAGEEQPLPGFEGLPPATLRDMEAAMAQITRGNGPPPGMYVKDDPEREGMAFGAGPTG